MSTQKTDTTAWIFQTWASFLLSMGTTGVGIFYLPVDAWVRGFMSMGLLFTVASSFTMEMAPPSPLYVALRRVMLLIVGEPVIDDI